ncbi:hypothetical protein BLA29_014080 [Euroglyphus maynei]|uniref:Uncharacterized protein n=1 Tax=Euroglyphus maynei TaxID=6958 RepID=A0A1Y3AWT0_EURMA|nr:hypothetical protein BLA29_014080 [Euroglyphus maynei]
MNILKCITPISNERELIPPQMLYHHGHTLNENEIIRQRRQLSQKRQKQYGYINSKSRIIYASQVLGPGSIYIPAMNDDAFLTTLFSMPVAIPTSQSFSPYYPAFQRM